MKKDYKKLFLKAIITSLKLESQLLKDRFKQVQEELAQKTKYLKEYIAEEKSKENEETD